MPAKIEPLKTKILPPQVRSHRVARPRLLERLAAVRDTPLTLVCAPAGYGKTTLLVEWAASAGMPVAWMSLSQEDSDAARFLNDFILALQRIQPEVGKSAQAALNVPTPDMQQAALHLLVNDLADFDFPAAVVLDDYHWVDAPEVHAALAHLVEHLPLPLHLLIASRVEPPLPLARLRARAAILELRTADLSFQPDESESFLNDVMALGLSNDECQRLVQQTEGWAAALQLAAISLQSGERNHVFTAGQHYIFEYLAEEVLRCQPLALQRFLLRTSILDQLTGPLCEALAEPFLPGQSGADCLDTLEHASLFTQALDGEHRWYRYHALFADFLRLRLRSTEPELVPQLHRLAAHWLAAHGDFAAAYQHALAGADLELAADLIEQSAERLELRGELDTLARWIDALPEALVRSRPRLNLGRAWGCLVHLDLHGTQRYLERAEIALEKADQSARLLIESNIQPQTAASDRSVLGEILAARALLAGLQGKTEDARCYGEKALQNLSSDQHYLLGLLKFNMSLPLFLTGQMAQGVRVLEEASFQSLQLETPFIALLCMRMLGEGYIHIGRLMQAELTFRQLEALVGREWGQHSPLMGAARLGLGEVYRQRNQLDLAEGYLTEAIAQCMLWMPAIALDGFIWLATLQQGRGDFAAAQATVQRVRQSSQGRGYALLDDWWVLITTVRLNILQGYLDDAMRWARDCGLDLENLGNLDEFFTQSPNYFRELACCLLARLYLELGRREKVPGALEKAQAVLAYLRPINEQSGIFITMMERLLLGAQVDDALGNVEAAQESLHRALDLTAPERPIRIFLDEGEALMTLLAARRSLDLPPVERAYLEELLAAWELERPQKSQPRAAAPQAGLIEPLSFREVEVLRLIAAGQSNQEIASGLVLALNTVKRHVSTIMGKLGARNRTEAVRIARQTGLLES